MFRIYCKHSVCWGFSLLLILTACEKKSQETSGEPKKEVAKTTKPETKIKEVPVPGQMAAHGERAGSGMSPHGDMSGSAMSAHGGMPDHGGMAGGEMASHGGMGPDVTAGDLAEPFKPKRKSTRTVEVSEEVKKKWKQVNIYVRDKQSGKTEHYTVKMHTDFKIPHTDLDVKVGDFLPHFTMPSMGKITSASNEPNNPALQVVISEKGEEKYSGWLFANFPEMHAFEHEKYAIGLDNNF